MKSVSESGLGGRVGGGVDGVEQGVGGGVAGGVGGGEDRLRDGWVEGGEEA